MNCSHIMAAVKLLKKATSNPVAMHRECVSVLSWFPSGLFISKLDNNKSALRSPWLPWQQKDSYENDLLIICPVINWKDKNLSFTPSDTWQEGNFRLAEPIIFQRQKV